MAKKPSASADRVVRFMEQLSSKNVVKRQLVIALMRAPNEDLVRRLAITEIILEQTRLLMNDVTESLIQERGISDDAMRLFELLDSFIKRGKKVLDGAKKGHEETHGTEAAKAQRWAEYQGEFDQILMRRPNLSKTRICELVAEKLNKSRRNVSLHIKDPREIGTLPATVRKRKA